MTSATIKADSGAVHYTYNTTKPFLQSDLEEKVNITIQKIKIYTQVCITWDFTLMDEHIHTRISGMWYNKQAVTIIFIINFSSGCCSSNIPTYLISKQMSSVSFWS